MLSSTITQRMGYSHTISMAAAALENGAAGFSIDVNPHSPPQKKKKEKKTKKKKKESSSRREDILTSV